MKDFIDKLNAIQRQHAMAGDYAKTLLLLQSLKSGEIALDDVTIQPDGWSVAERAPDAEPAAPTIANVVDAD